MAAKVRNEYWYGRSRLKSGKPGNRLIARLCPYCPIERCSTCGRFGSETWIRRWYIRPFKRVDLRTNEHEWTTEPFVCIGCMARFRRLWEAECIIEENRLLIGRIKREIARVNAENRRRAAWLPR